MLDQAIYSIQIGAIICVIAFIPLLMWQYRRYGAFQLARTFWTFVSYTYVTALIAYTLFPMPDLSGDYCATHPRVLILDPTLYFREMTQNLSRLSLQQALMSWDVLQMVFNVALFVPLGVIFSRFLRLRAPAGILAGFGVSLFVEATQYTAIWGIMLCSYRVADVNDLMTNTLGVALGYLVARIIPGVSSSPSELRAMRGHARRVTRRRRWAGMLLDVVYWFTLWGVLFASLSVVLMVLTRDNPTDQRALQWLLHGMIWLGIISALMVALPAALSGSGASLGQRTVYLRPAPAPRWRLILRAFIVQGVLMITTLRIAASAGGLLSLLGMMMWGPIAILSVIRTTDGLSGKLSGCRIIDSRELTPNGEIHAGEELRHA